MVFLLKWLIIGVGDITSKRVIPAIQAHPQSELHAIVTRDPAKAETYGVPAYTALSDALSTSSATAVYVASPVFLHAQNTIASLRAGMHVLCEKPVAMNYAEACLMQQTAEETGRTLGIASYRRTYPKVNRALDLIKEGAIGTPVLGWHSRLGCAT
jgi:predicted dehydrogenase